MVYLYNFILGVLQGITEFLPVSSSGHLVIFERLFNIKPSIALNVSLHIGSLAAIIFYYKKDVFDLIKTALLGIKGEKKLDDPEIDLILKIILATFITGIMGLLLKDPIENIFHSSSGSNYLGVTFLFTAVLLFVSQFFRISTKNSFTWNQTIIMGLVQGLAVLPGISRSGTTIAIALFLGINKKESARFSFLLAIPIIMGAGILELKSIVAFGNPGPIILGVVSAGVVGFLSLIFLIKFINKGKLHWFSYYLFPLAFYTFFFSK
jgi:undecaprenyl-diphosphatase